MAGSSVVAGEVANRTNKSTAPRDASTEHVPKR